MLIFGLQPNLKTSTVLDSTVFFHKELLLNLLYCWLKLTCSWLKLTYGADLKTSTIFFRFLYVVLLALTHVVTLS